MADTRHFGRKVRVIRESKGWSIKYVAGQCNICDKCLEQIELGDTDPKLSNILKIAAVLDMDLGELNSCIPVIA